MGMGWRRASRCRRVRGKAGDEDVSEGRSASCNSPTRYGKRLVTERRPLAPIAPGEAVITSGHNLPNPWVIHCLGPIYGQDRPEDRLLASCYREALRIAEEKGLRSVAFPALSTGAFGYPMEPAARIALVAVLDMAPDLRSVRHVRFVLYGQRDLQVHQEVLEELTGGATTGEA
jgi:O-acetyl-ADP-ribose deacetylase